MLSDLRSPGRVGRPAGADLVGTCAGDGKVGMYDMLRSPGTNTLSTFVGDGVCGDVMPMCYVSANMGDLCEVLFLGGGKAYSLQLAPTTTGLGAWATTAGNTNGDVEAWYIAPKILLGICMCASSTSFFTSTAVLCSRHQSIDN